MQAQILPLQTATTNRQQICLLLVAGGHEIVLDFAFVVCGATQAFRVRLPRAYNRIHPVKLFQSQSQCNVKYQKYCIRTLAGPSF